MTGSSINFQNQQIFGKGFRSGMKDIDCILMRLLSSDVLNLDGTLDVHELKQSKTEKKQVWQYAYYLWFHNKDTIDRFKAMSDDKVPSRASAKNFVLQYLIYKGDITIMDVDKEVNYSKIDIRSEQLADFVNYLVAVGGASRLIIPFVDSIRTKLLQKLSGLGAGSASSAALPYPYQDASAAATTTSSAGMQIQTRMETSAADDTYKLHIKLIPDPVA